MASTDHDTPWKEALELFLPQFLAFFFPRVHEAIDWSRGYESLDKELRQIAPDAELGQRLADKLFKTWLLGGEEAWLYIHIEVQGKQEREFDERMFVYHYRIFDRFHQFGVSLAVLCDANPGWRPSRFEYNVLGCSGSFEFLVAKVLDYRGRESELEQDANPFAAVVLAQLVFLDTRQMPEERKVQKLALIKGLYRRGLEAKQIRQLFFLIDWMLSLPEDLDKGFWADLQHFEEERRMPYVSSVERLGIEKGRFETLFEVIPAFLETKFGKEGKQLMPEIRAIKDAGQLQKLFRALKTAKNLDSVHKLLHRMKES